MESNILFSPVDLIHFDRGIYLNFDNLYFLIKFFYSLSLIQKKDTLRKASCDVNRNYSLKQ